MHAILRNLLDFARMERREVERVDLVKIAEAALGTVRHQPDFRETVLTLHIEGEPSVLGEASKLHQAVVNLLLNAGSAGAKSVRVAVAVRPTGVEIEVRDDGQGIAPENLGRILEPFFTTRPPGAGTGLGLAIVHRVAEEHGARIHVDSALGAGSVFRLCWPPQAGAVSGVSLGSLRSA
jgi:signal transduction histidine kinase